MKKWLNEKGEFVVLGEKALSDITDAKELAEYFVAKSENEKEAMDARVEKLEKALETAGVKEEEIKTVSSEFKAQIKEMENIALQIKADAEKAVTPATVDGFKAKWDSKFSDIEGMKAKKNSASLEFEVKASQSYGDITLGEDFAAMRSGVTDQPVRDPFIRSLFSTIPLSTEFYKYVEQDTVIRDAQNVAICSPVTSTTKETLIVRNMSTQVVKDMMDFCVDFVEDYPFMRSRITKLINESISLRVDQQLLLGTGAGNETFSIDSYSSEFDATNVVCPLNVSIQAANYVDLILGMQTQIVALGEENSFMPDTALVNFCDWFKLVRSAKDLDNNYLDQRIVERNGQLFVGGMRVVTNPIVAPNTCYVMDSTKGEVLDRKTVNVDIAFQNKDNWESEIATIKGYVRINLWVPVNNQNAFMKCSDVATAITAITKL